MKPRVIAFDCLNTIFSLADVPEGEVAGFVAHCETGERPYAAHSCWYDLYEHGDVHDAFCDLQMMNIRLVAFSNANDDVIKVCSKKCNLKWSDFVFPYKYKPSLAAYQELLAQCKVAPERLMIVTANPRFGDIQGAKSIGARCVVVRDKACPEGVPFFPTLRDLVRHISELEEPLVLCCG